MKRVIGYIRVSTDGQCKEDKFGLEVQRQQIEEYCGKNEMEIIEWVSDEGESGAKERPGFDRIVYGDIQNPPIEAVVVAKSDRVARDIEIYYYYKMLLRKKDIGLISIAEDFGQFGVFSDMLESFTLCVAKMERENINKRTSAGRYVKAAGGGYSGGRVPYGYRTIDRRFTIYPEEAEHVKEIFRMKDDERKTYREIADYLNENHVPTKSGKQWAISSVQAIYENKKLYQGYYKYGKEMNWVRGVHEPILKD